MRSILVLIVKLRDVGIEVKEEDFIRTRAGKNMLSGGAFSWFFTKSNGRYKTVGSICPIKDFIKKDIKISILDNGCGGIEIFPEKIT